ncbi:aspartate aminotransferase family protein [Streptomyces sp. WAC 06738]|uniref:pyridoxal phosphate-dependent decarboxylase family protein n=1 Tax=Streptomyces sp. WAC 06738 TaxID=2203210 RepID=UPI000F6B8358|nr:aminotransferase class V-fold PLP-dependent enzyme [Streptomyces sp. WAC 06738]AZM45479.1 aspartate aminotransferase family protein [Streptomyces sp. WAC 06738]
MPAAAEAALAGGPAGPRALRPYLDTVLAALGDGADRRRGPLPAGGPAAVAARVREAVRPVLPDTGVGADAALAGLVRLLAEGAADPADPHCAAHLHAPPLAVAAAADLAAGALNPSLDSWDQAPAAAELEAEVAAAVAAEVHPGAARPDALVTTGGTEANQLALLLARELLGPGVQVVAGASAHHSVRRAAWLLGMRAPHVVPTPRGVLDPAAVRDVLAEIRGPGGAPGPALVVATAGTTDAGAVDPLPALADAAAAHGARLHVDAAYGGLLLLAPARAHLVDGLDRAHTVALDLHKLGWQPIAAGFLAVRDDADLAPLAYTADYLSADDDTDAGLPALLHRSLRTTRRADVLKIAVTLRALGRAGIAELVEGTFTAAAHLAELVEEDPELELYAPPTLTTVLFRPAGADDAAVAALRRRLLADGHAVLGRAEAGGRRWLKATLLNPHVHPGDLRNLLKLVTEAHRAPALSPRQERENGTVSDVR